MTTIELKNEIKRLAVETDDPQMLTLVLKFFKNLRRTQLKRQSGDSVVAPELSTVVTEDDDLLYGLVHNPALDFLLDEEEDVYSDADLKVKYK